MDKGHDEELIFTWEIEDSNFENHFDSAVYYPETFAF